MNKLILAAATCGLLSSVAVAEPLRLNEGALGDVAGGVITNTETFTSTFMNNSGFTANVDLSLTPGNTSSVTSTNGVSSADQQSAATLDPAGAIIITDGASGGFVSATQSAGVSQLAPVYIGPIK